MRVTQILKAVGLIDIEWATQEDMDRGTAVHACTAMMDKGEEIDPNSIDPRVAPYLPGWTKFKAEMRPEILAIEERVEHPVYKYHGTLDRIIRVGHAEIVADIKTGPPAPWHAVQLAGYALCFTRPLDRWGIYLNSDGGYRLEKYGDRKDYDVFKAALTVASFIERNK